MYDMNLMQNSRNLDIIKKNNWHLIRYYKIFGSCEFLHSNFCSIYALAAWGYVDVSLENM